MANEKRKEEFVIKRKTEGKRSLLFVMFQKEE
jgi:hypothetical protein